MIKINPYLNFDGNTEEAFKFYKSVFGGEFTAMQRFGETPTCPEMGELDENDRDKIMHIALPIGRDTVLMATDVLDSMNQHLTVGNNCYLSIDVESKEEADQLFAGLSDDGQVTMPLDDTFWGAYFGMLKDKFGIQWMINYDYKEQ